MAFSFCAAGKYRIPGTINFLSVVFVNRVFIDLIVFLIRRALCFLAKTLRIKIRNKNFFAFGDVENALKPLLSTYDS